MYGEKPKLPIKTIFFGVVGLILLFIGLSISGSTLEHMDTTEVMVVQSLTGNLTWHHGESSGWKVQAMGKPTKYPKRSQYWFDANPDTGSAGTDQSIKVRFNDGGEGNISGSIAWEMPKGEELLTAIHQKYGTAASLEQDLIRTVVEKSVYMTGPLMSSKESYADRRNELIHYIEDQIKNGVYDTETETVTELDQMSGEEKTVNYVRIVMDDAGLPKREEASPLLEFGIRTFNLSINQIAYDKLVEDQFRTQQQATMQVQTAIAEAKQAEQQAITAAEHGKAEAAKAKWEQEVVKAKAVTKAQQELEVARLDRAAAAEEKAKQILLGQGEAERRRLVMSADNALDARLEAWVKVNERYAQAIENIKQPLVPLVQSGNGSGSGQTAVQDLISIIMAEKAKELGVRSNPAK
jgi:regulator of protease activity HflC (stomatin/prohibitin superfamily)